MPRKRSIREQTHPAEFFYAKERKREWREADCFLRLLPNELPWSVYSVMDGGRGITVTVTG